MLLQYFETKNGRFLSNPCLIIIHDSFSHSTILYLRTAAEKCY